MPFVVDASVAATWLLPDEGNLVADVAYQRLLTDTALVPSICWYEMRNIFVSNERPGRISSEHAARALTLLAGNADQERRDPGQRYRSGPCLEASSHGL